MKQWIRKVGDQSGSALITRVPSNRAKTGLIESGVIPNCAQLVLPFLDKTVG